MKQGKIGARVLPRALWLLLLAGPGCATMTGGAGDQKVKITSTPPGASVVVDGQPRGPAPIEVALNERLGHLVQISSPGYETANVTLLPTINPWVFGNALFGLVGVVGGIVDVYTDSVYELTPDTVQVTLRGLSPAPVAAAPAPQGAPPGR